MLHPIRPLSGTKACRVLAALLSAGIVMLGLSGCSDKEAPTETTAASTAHAETTAPTEATTAPDSITGTVTAELNVRGGPGTEYESVGTVSSGTKVTVHEIQNEWCRIDEGWISLRYVQLDSAVSEAAADALSGITISDSLSLYGGPGVEHDSIGSLSIHTRVQILETSGDWVHTDLGWVSASGVYIDGTRVEGVAEMATVTGSRVNIRQGPGTGYEDVGTVSEGKRVEILFQLTLEDRAWGCTDDGWICMDYVRLDSQPPEGTPPENSSVVGCWIAMPDAGSFLSSHQPSAQLWNFAADGTFTVNDCEYAYFADSGWSRVSSDTGDRGTYTFDGSTLTMHVTGYRLDGQWTDEDRGETHTLEVVIEGDAMTIANGNSAGFMLRDADISQLMAEVIRQCAAQSDSAILGNWCAIDAEGYLNGENPSPQGWTFNEDGTFSCSFLYAYDPEQGWQSVSGGATEHGVYIYNGETLTLCYTHTTNGSIPDAVYFFQNKKLDIDTAGAGSIRFTDGTVMYQDTTFEELNAKLQSENPR